MTNLKTAVEGSVITLVAFIMSIISMFVGFLFLPLLNRAGFMTADARTLLEQVYPVLMVLIPLFVLIAGLVTTAFVTIAK